MKGKKLKTTIIQVGKDFFSLEYMFSIKNAEELPKILKMFNVRLLQEKGD